MNPAEYPKSVFTEIYGLSCVENLILYLLKTKKIAYQNLYCDSFLTFHEIEQAFYMDRCSYASFHRIQRLQEIATREKIIHMELLDGDFSFASEGERHWLVMVNPNFARDKYKRELWRNDHFILLSPGENRCFNYLNDNPYDTGIITSEEFYRYYQGEAVAVEIINRHFRYENRVYARKLLESVHTDTARCDWDGIARDTVRDTVGILRIIRRRMFSLLSSEYDVSFMTPFLKSFDRVYAALEYMRLKKQADDSRIRQLRESVMEDDRRMLYQIICITEKELSRNN